MRTGRRLLGFLCLIGAVAATAATALAATTDWGTAIAVPGLEISTENLVTSISCVSAGNCAAAGYFRGRGPGGPSFVVDERDGVWGTDLTVRYGIADEIAEISCTAVGSCAAAGTYLTEDDNNPYNGFRAHAFVLNERHGVWGKPMKVPGMKRLDHGTTYLNAISCSKPGFCVAGGSYGNSSGKRQQAFLVNETRGVWQKAIKVPGTAALNVGRSANVSSISCVNARRCTAGGTYLGKEGSEPATRAFVVDERKGVWGKAVEVRGAATLGRGSTLTSLSCSEPGACAAGGTYSENGVGPNQAFVVNEKHGLWRKAIVVPGLAALDLGGATLYSISCASAGSCAASGSYIDGPADTQAFVVSEKNGKWRKAIEVPGSAALNAGGQAETFSVSCAKAEFCGAGGYYMDGSGGQQAFVVSETNGVWNTAVEVPGSAVLNDPGIGLPGEAAVNAVSCGGARSCVAGGYYVGASHTTQSFVTSP